MSDHEVAGLKEMLYRLDEKINRVEDKIDIVGRSLKKCQTHCYIDNPPTGKWKVFFKSFLAIFKLR
jgi:hypothetical protein